MGQKKKVMYYPVITSPGIEFYMSKICFDKLVDVEQWCNVEMGMDLFRDVLENIIRKELERVNACDRFR